MGLQLGARPVRDVGRARLRRRSTRPDEEGRRGPPAVDRQDARERARSASTRTTAEVVRPRRKSEYVASAQVDPRDRDARRRSRKGGAPVLKNDGAEAWDLGDGVLGLTFKTKANSIDADVIKMIHDVGRERAETRLPRDGRRQRGRALLRRREPVPRRRWRRRRSSGSRSARWCGGYQDATQRMKYATRAGRRRALRHDARRRARAVLRRGDGAGGGGDVRRPRRGRRRAHPRRRGHDEHAVARARGRCPTARTSTRTQSSRRCSRTSRWRRSRRAPRRRRRSATSAAPTACRSTARASSPRRRRARSASPRAAITRRRRGRTCFPGESGIATLAMMVDTLVAGG